MMKGIFKTDIARMIIALTAVGVLSGLALVFVYVYTQAKIEENMNMAMAKAVEGLFPDMDKAAGKEKVKNIRKEPAAVVDKSSKLLGYAFLAEGNGYQGTIKLMAGIDPGLTELKGFEVLESQETPGLGAEITGDKFKDQFKNLQVTHEIEYVKNKKPEESYQIEAITGATISSRAVVNILNKAIAELKKELGK